MTLRDQYESTFRTLSRLDLQGGAHGIETLEMADLFGSSSHLFLGFYTEQGLQTAFERYRMASGFSDVGFPDVRVETHVDDGDEHLLRVWDPNNDHAPLVELVVRRGTIRPVAELADRIDAEILSILQIDWLLLQNPTGDFSQQRPPLPGQAFPGLGIGLQVLELLRLTCRRLNLDGLATVPSYFHNAFFYSEEFLYFDPHVQGVFLAACRDILPQCMASPAAASWAILWKMVLEEHAQDRAFEWFHDVQVAPISERLTTYLQQTAYDREVESTLSTHSFKVLTSRLLPQLEQKGIQPLDLERIQSWIRE